MARGETGKNFYLVSGPRDIDVRRQIAQSCGVPLRSVSINNLKTTFILDSLGRIAGLPISPAPSFVDRSLDPHTVSAIKQQAFQRTEVLLDEPPIRFSYGLYIPNYDRGLRRQKEEQAGEKQIASRPHQALLVGALTPDTIQEYAATVRDVFPDVQCNVIDIMSEVTAKVSPDIANFIYADGLRMPFRDNSMDSVHLNHLLWMLTDITDSNRDKADARKQLFSGIRRVLKKGGRLMFAETTETMEGVLDELFQAGFRESSQEPATYFSSRREMDRFLRSTAQDPLPGTTSTTQEIQFVIAKK